MSPSDTLEAATKFETLSDSEKLDVIYQQLANLSKQYTRVEALVSGVLTDVAPTLERLMKSPMLKVLGLGK